MTIAELANTKLDLCLDFANPMDWHASDQPEELLLSYSELVAWARAAGLVTDAEAEELRRLAEEQTDEAARALARARSLRDCIYRIFVALTVDEPPAASDLGELNEALSGALQGARVGRSADGFAWEWEAGGGTLDGMLGPVARSAGALLTSDMRARIGQCADDRGCGYLFLDTSKNHSRRWCNMGGCGNRAKQRRYYRRSQPDRN